MNVDFDGTIHATNDDDGRNPLCDTSMMPACAPEATDEPVNCIWCESLIS